MESKTLFEGLRSLLDVAADVIVEVADNVLESVESLIDSAEQYVNGVLDEQAPQEPEAEPRSKAQELYDYLVENDKLVNEALNPEHPGHKNIGSYSLDYLYDWYVIQGN